MSGKLQQGGFLQQLLQQFSQTEVKKLQQLQQQQQQQQQQGGVKNKKSKSAKTKRGGGEDDPLDESKRVERGMTEEQWAEQKRLEEVYRREDEKWKKWEENKDAALEKQKENPINFDNHERYGGQFAGNVKVYTGPKEGKFIINKHGKKVYIDRKTLNNNVPYLKKKAKAKKAVKK
jgi:hypothetical protein